MKLSEYVAQFPSMTAARDELHRRGVPVSYLTLWRWLRAKNKPSPVSVALLKRFKIELE